MRVCACRFFVSLGSQCALCAGPSSLKTKWTLKGFQVHIAIKGFRIQGYRAPTYKGHLVPKVSKSVGFAPAMSSS